MIIWVFRRTKLEVSALVVHDFSLRLCADCDTVSVRADGDWEDTVFVTRNKRSRQMGGGKGLVTERHSGEERPVPLWRGLQLQRQDTEKGQHREHTSRMDIGGGATERRLLFDGRQSIRLIEPWCRREGRHVCTSPGLVGIAASIE